MTTVNQINYAEYDGDKVLGDYFPGDIVVLKDIEDTAYIILSSEYNSHPNYVRLCNLKYGVCVDYHVKTKVSRCPSQLTIKRVVI